MVDENNFLANWVNDSGQIPLPAATSAPVWVPCIPNFETDTFLPIYTVSSLYFQNSLKTQQWPAPKKPIPRGGIKQKKWTTAEDNKLKEHVSEVGVKNWSQIARLLNEEFHGNAEVRKGKHCRERWQNHVNPELNSKVYLEGEWSYQEDVMLLTSREKLGNKWSVISKELPGRTENAVKNRWHTLIRRGKKALGMQGCSTNTIANFLLREFSRSLGGQ